jgi:hypothetical protein
MGDATPPKEHILILLPLPPNQELLDGIKKQHPGVTITYHLLELKMVFGGEPHKIPDGIYHSLVYLLCLH